MAFLRNLLATLVGLFIFSILGFVILVGIMSVASSADEVPTVKDNSVLYIPLSGVLVEQVVENPLDEVLGDVPTPLALMDRNHMI